MGKRNMGKRKHTIKSILLIFCIFILFIPLLGLVFGVKISYSHLANRKINEILESKILQNDALIQNVMSKMIVVSGSIAINQEVVQYLESDSDGTGMLCSNALEQVEMLLANSFDLPMNIMIFGENKILKTWIGQADAGIFNQNISGILDKYSEQKKMIYWFYNEEGIFDFYSENGTRCLNSLRRIEVKEKGETYWVIASVDIDVLSKQLFGSRQDVAELYKLQDKNGQVLLNLYPDTEKMTEQEIVEQVSFLDDKVYYHAQSGFSSYGTSFQSSMIMDSQDLMVDLNQLNLIFYCGVAIILFVFIGGLVIFIRYLTKPLGGLIQAMERTTDKQEYLPVDVKTNIAEISTLNNWYNIMVESINDYIGRVKYQEQEKRRLHFQMLQMQINPHFLFNSLNSIKWVCYMNQDEKAGDLIAALGRMYEISMNKGALHLTLREEKEFMESYVRLMENRYDIKVDFSFHIEKDLEDVQLLKFILQPVVENVFLHGFQGWEGEKKIQIHAKKMDGKLYISVIDNGAGIPANKMEELQKDLKKTEREVTKVGIVNVNHRIRIHYGEEYGLWISNNTDYCEGTWVQVVLPIKQEGGNV